MKSDFRKMSKLFLKKEHEEEIKQTGKKYINNYYRNLMYKR